MAPTRKQQRKSPSPKVNETPERSPIKKSIMITQRQKQALIDNLQLEITERARRLRAQYVLQAQSLRSKLERRVSRVPPALRHKTMGELLMKYATTKEPEKQRVQVAKKTTVRKDTANIEHTVNPASPPKARGTKRKSDEMLEYDKENTPDPSAVPVPKRQARDAAGGRTHPSTVLSPKSNNSRTLPQSPVRPAFGSPAKALIRPQSPLKPVASPFKSAAAAATAGLASMVSGKATKPAPTLSRTNSKTTKAPVRTAKPAVAQPRTVSAASNTSGSTATSSGTIVRRVGNAIKSSVVPKPTAKAKATVPKKTVGARTKSEQAKPEPVRRTLRSRA